MILHSWESYYILRQNEIVFQWSTISNISFQSLFYLMQGLEDKFSIFMIFHVERYKVTFNRAFFTGMWKGSSLPMALSSLIIFSSSDTIENRVQLTLLRIMPEWVITNYLQLFFIWLCRKHIRAILGKFGT